MGTKAEVLRALHTLLVMDRESRLKAIVDSYYPPGRARSFTWEPGHWVIPGLIQVRSKRDGSWFTPVQWYEYHRETDVFEARWLDNALYHEDRGCGHTYSDCICYPTQLYSSWMPQSTFSPSFGLIKALWWYQLRHQDSEDPFVRLENRQLVIDYLSRNGYVIDLWFYPLPTERNGITPTSYPTKFGRSFIGGVQIPTGTTFVLRKVEVLEELILLVEDALEISEGAEPATRVASQEEEILRQFCYSVKQRDKKAGDVAFRVLSEKRHGVAGLIRSAS